MTDFGKDLLHLFDYLVTNLEDITLVYDMAAGSIYTASMVVVGHDDIVSDGMDLAERALRDNTARLNALRNKVVDLRNELRKMFERMEAADHEE